MRLLLIILLISAQITLLKGQLVSKNNEQFGTKMDITNKQGLKIAKYGLVILSGVFDGTAEALRYHYPQFKQTFPGANDQFWNPSLSWRNKYAGGDPQNGPRFPGSTTVFVGMTDGFHLFRTLTNVTLMGAVTINICERKRWYLYLVDFVTFYICKQVGFFISYELIFNK